MGDRINNESKKRSISSSVKCAITHTSLLLSEHTIVLFVCMSEMLEEMAVMLSKIFILLAVHSSETYSYLADMETVKEREEWGLHPLLKCQDVINSYKVNMEDFILCLCQDKDFSQLSLSLLSSSLPFLTPSQLLTHSPLCDTMSLCS